MLRGQRSLNPCYAQCAREGNELGKPLSGRRESPGEAEGLPVYYERYGLITFP